MDSKQVEGLLEEYDDHRKAIKVMIKDLEGIKDMVDTIIPKTMEARYIRFFEEKIKTVTALFNALLEMRKEIARSVREEIEIRRKLDTGDNTFEIEDVFNVRDFADKIDEFKQKQQKMKEKLKSDQDLTDYKDIEIPGITERIIT
jgi:hypothetical protein